MGIVTLTWMTCGFSLAFGGDGPLLGNLDYAFLVNLDMVTWLFCG